MTLSIETPALLFSATSLILLAYTNRFLTIAQIVRSLKKTYDEKENKTWDCTLDIYGKVITVNKGMEFDCPFRFQGQYVDEESGLYYNRFRYYEPRIGSSYLSIEIKSNSSQSFITFVLFKRFYWKQLLTKHLLTFIKEVFRKFFNI